MPPKKKNNASCNAFYFFMLDVRAKSNKKNSMSLAEASEIAGQKWKLMNEEQRAPFKEQAKKEKERMRFGGEKYTSTGIPLSEIDREEKEKQQKEKFMIDSIKKMIQVATDNCVFNELDFFFVDVNIFCYTNENYYVPAEISVARLNFQNGVYDVFYKAINPMEIPPGYSYTAKLMSEERHKMPLPPDAIGESDTGKILEELIAFLMKDGDKIPFLFTLPSNMKTVEMVLDQLCAEKGYESQFTIFNVTELFKFLMNEFTPNKFESSCFAQSKLDNDVYEFYRNLACDFHENTDGMQHCTLSKVKRWAFTIFDYCTRFLNIEMLPGQHVPKEAAAKLKIIKQSSRPPSVLSSTSMQSLPYVLSRSGSECDIKSEFDFESGISYANCAAGVSYHRPASPAQSMSSEFSAQSIKYEIKEEELDISEEELDIKEEKIERIKEEIDSFDNCSLFNPSTSASTQMNSVRRPNTVPDTKFTAALHLGYTTDTSADEQNWTEVRRLDRGRGRRMRK